MSTIYEFYKAKDELLRQINKDYEQYLNKKVNIILKGEKHPTPLEYAQVIYEGIYFQNGFLNLKYRCVKK